DKRVKEKHILKLEEQTLWLIHEKPFAPMTPSFLPLWWESRLDPEQNKSGKPDIVIFGHEHRLFKQYMDGVLFFSPGSPTFLNYKRGPGTVAILELNTGSPDLSIIQL
ncbi:MAG: metallophosphoesterase family protein, partial [Dehalococcoidales bacterium]